MSRTWGTVAISLTLSAVCLAPLGAQETGGDATVRAGMQLTASGTHVKDDVALLVGGGVGLGMGTRAFVGGAGYAITSAIALGEVEFQDVELTFGYGGLVVDWALSNGPSGAWIGRLLLGAGHADIRTATELRVDSDNFFVVEPSVGFRRALRGRASWRVDVSYRYVTEVQDLRTVSASDFRSLSLQISLGLFPL